MVEVKRIVEEWEIWDKEEEVARLEAEAKKLVLERFHKWIKVFGKKQSENANKKGVGSHNRCEGRVCAKKGEDVSIVKRGKGEGKRVC